MSKAGGLQSAALSVAAGAALISLAAPFVKIAQVPATVSGFYRMAFAVVIMAIWMLPRRHGGLLQRDGWLGSAAAGLFFALDLWFWHRSILWVGPGIATLLANLQVIFLALVGVFWFRERLRWPLLLGLALAMAGLWLLLGFQWPGFSGRYKIGIGFGVLTALAYTAYLLTLRSVQSGSGLSPLERMFQVSLCCTLAMAVFTWLEGQSLALPDVLTVSTLLGYALLCQVLGWIFISKGLPLLPASLIGLLLLLQPGLSLLWDYLFFGLTAQGLQWLGAAMVLLGIYLGAVTRNKL